MVEISLTEEEKTKLLRIARKSVKEAASGSKRGMGGAADAESAETRVTEESLKVEAGAFVSLHKGGKLRGCIGRFEAEGPLFRTVENMAKAASVNDFRFNKVTPEEVEDIDIEISVLSPLKRIGDVSEIEVGRHGLYIIRGSYRGTLLPQVASERGWDRETFLEQTCLKAGIGKNEWKNEATEIYTYEALVFGED
jgi:hypothetical protein